MWMLLAGAKPLAAKHGAAVVLLYSVSSVQSVHSKMY